MATHSTIMNSKGTCALFGNMFEAMEYDGSEPIKTWYKRMLYMSVQKCFGDLDLFVNGRLIRSVYNANRRILDKESKYPVKYKKY